MRLWVFFVLAHPYFYGNTSTEESSDGGVLSDPFADILLPIFGLMLAQGLADLIEEAPKD